jgi:hypothetical protein
MKTSSKVRPAAGTRVVEQRSAPGPAPVAQAGEIWANCMMLQARSMITRETRDDDKD